MPFGFDEKEFALLRDEIERFVMMKESWSPQELELQTCCGSIVEHARLYSLEATKPAQLGDGNNVGVHLPQYGRQRLTASTSFTTQWRNNNDVEAFEEKLGVGEILEDRAAVAEQLGYQLLVSAGCATHKDVGGDANVNANLGSNGVLANFQLAAGQLEVHASGGRSRTRSSCISSSNMTETRMSTCSTASREGRDQ
ncbi:hypothetical protein PC120_g833 [Phytophthora cactorum]|nr:hypothetical protein PC120_g833 [Phytophthora cactorum]